MPFYRMALLVFIIILSSVIKSLRGDDVIPNPDEKNLENFHYLLKTKRIEQIDVMKDILNFKYEQKYKMVSMVLNETFKGFPINRLLLEDSGYIPGSFIPSNSTIKDALYQLLINTALFAEFQLKMPDITERIMSKNKQWIVLAKWAIRYSNSTSLYDHKTTELMNLVAQEMNLIERSPNYINPYREKSKMVQKSTEKSKTVPKKKVKFAKGPRIAASRHSEL